MRKYVTYDGDVLEETHWALKPTDSCFYCNLPLVLSNQTKYCPDSQDGNHDWITLCNPDSSDRR